MIEITWSVNAVGIACYIVVMFLHTFFAFKRKQLSELANFLSKFN